jgi:hypothetical protein
VQFTRVGDLDIVTRITGPTHHFLGIAFSPVPNPEMPVLERVSLDHPLPEVETFDPTNDLCREVLEALHESNDRLGTQLGVKRIRYCADDPPGVGVYRRLVQALIEHVIWEQAVSPATVGIDL